MSLKRRLSQPGITVSALAHVGVLAATLIAFSQTDKFDDHQETVPVEVVTDNQFNQIMKGDKSAKAVHPEATPGPEQAASTASPTPPEPPTPEQPQAAPPPPPPPPPSPPPPPQPKQRQADHQPAPTPPPRPATPPPPEPPAAVPTPPVRDVEAEPVLPKPVPKPVVKPPPPPVPLPPVVPHPTVAKLPPKPHPVEKPKVDQLAKLMEEQPDTPEPAPPTPKPAPAPKPAVTHARPTHDASQDSKFDPTDISKLLNHAAAAPRPASTQQLSHLASLGSPTASAPKMSPSFWAGLDGLLEDQYRGCWSYLGLAAGSKYVPQVRVMYGPDGSLQGQPVLLNPTSDPELQNLADSALRAVRRCNPLKIPEQYAPYYEQWKGRVLRFDPQEMAG